jgi:hypothetical protein
MSKRKTAARKPVKKPPLTRRYVIVNIESGRQVYGSDPRKYDSMFEWGMPLEQAERWVKNLKHPSKIVPADEHYGIPNPEDLMADD